MTKIDPTHYWFQIFEWCESNPRWLNVTDIRDEKYNAFANLLSIDDVDKLCNESLKHFDFEVLRRHSSEYNMLLASNTFMYCFNSIETAKRFVELARSVNFDISITDCTNMAANGKNLDALIRLKHDAPCYVTCYTSMLTATQFKLKLC